MKRFLLEIGLMHRGVRKYLWRVHLELTLICALMYGLFFVGHGVFDLVEEHLLGGLPQQLLNVSPKRKSIAFFEVPETDAKQEIAAADLQAMTQVQGVVDITPFQFGSQSSRADISFMGNSFNSDLVLISAPQDYLAVDIDPERLAWGPDRTVPIVLNSEILAIFNNGYAQSQGLPRLSADAVMAPSWRLTYGSGADAVRLRARIVGFSPRVPLGAVTTDAVLNYLHEQLGLDVAPVTEAVLHLDGQADADSVRRAIDDLGFRIQEPPPLAQIFLKSKHIATLSGVVLVVLLMLICFSYLQQSLKSVFLIKVGDYAVCRALGMSRQRLLRLLAFESGLLTAADLALGLLLGYLFAQLAGHFWLSPYLQDLLGLPLQISTPGALYLIAATLIWLLSWLFLWPAIYRAITT